MPIWPGPVLTIVGFVTGAGVLVAADPLLAEYLPAGTRTALLVIGVAAAATLVAGLVYAVVRQLRRRRTLPPDRYRGPSVVLLLILAAVLANLASLPFLAELQGLLTGEETELSLLAVVVTITATQVALLLVTWLFVLRPRALAFAHPLLGRAPIRALLAGIAWGLPAWLVSSVLTVAIALLLERIGLGVEPQIAALALDAFEPWLMVVAIVLLAPVAEELFFRGVAFNVFLRERGRRVAYVGSSLLFAVIHLSLVSLLPIAVLGLALAWIYRRSGSLLAPIAMHATVNGVSTAIALLVRFDVIRLPAT